MNKAMTKHKTTIALLLLASISTAAHAGIRRHDRDDALYQNLANESQFQSVARLQVLGPSGPRTCSGTLINSQWILTAAHCFDGVETPNAAALLDGAFGLADQIVINPNWTQGQVIQGGDLALIHLSIPITNITPATLFSGTNEIGLAGTGVGYGRSGTGNTGQIFGTLGTKRAGTNIIDALGSELGFHESILMTDFDNPLRESDSTFGSTIPTNLEYQVAGGDSGGALFIQENGQYLLAGVTSFINSTNGPANGNYGDMSAYTRLSDYNNWINSVIPAPSGLMVLWVGMFGVSRRRRLV